MHEATERDRERRRSSRRPFRATDVLPHSAVAALAALLLAGFLAQQLGGAPSADPTEDIGLRFSAIGVLIWRGDLYRLVTYPFLHHNLIHLLLDFAALWWLGNRIEGRHGAAFTIAAFVGTGVAGATAAYVWEPPTAVVVGASAALFGFAGIELATAEARSDVRDLLVALLIASVVATVLIPNVSHVAHAGGFVGGLVFGGLARLTDDPRLRRIVVPAIGLLAISAIAVAVVQTVTPAPS